MKENPSEEIIAEISEALAEGEKIQAIKVFRESTGVGLKEAKEFIDDLIPMLIKTDPEKYAKLTKSGGGCSALLVFGLLVSGTVLSAFFA